MSNFLLINGYPVPVSVNASGEVDYQEVGGEVVRAYAGNLLSSVKATARVWKVVTVPMPNQMALGLASTLEQPYPLACDGVFVGGPVTCRARGVRTMAVATAYGPHRVVEFELHEEAPAKSPWSILFGYQGGNLFSNLPLNFSRPSPALYRDRSGVWQEAAPGVPRTSWGTDPVTGLLVPRYLTEPGATNLVPGNRQRFEGWDAWQGTQVTVTQGQTIPGWTRAGEATRVQTTGGSETAKLRLQVGTVQQATPVMLSAVITNIGAAPVRITHVGGAAPAEILPGQTRRLVSSDTRTGELWFQVRATSPGDDLDFIAYAPQVELTPYATSPILDPTASSPDPTSRDRDTLYMDLPEEIQRPGAPMAVYSRCVVGASGSDMGNHPGVWAITNVSGSGPRLALYLHSTSSRPVLVHQNDVTISQFVAVTPAAGDLLETLSIVWSDGQGRLTGRLIASVNRGPLAAADLPPLAPAAAWSAPRLYVGSRGTAPGVYEYEALKLYAGRLSGSDEEMMAFMAAFGGV